MEEQYNLNPCIFSCNYSLSFFIMQLKLLKNNTLLHLIIASVNNVYFITNTLLYFIDDKNKIIFLLYGK